MSDIRLKNLKQLIRQHDGPTNLAKKIGMRGPSYVSQMAMGHRPVSERMARMMEEVLDLPTGWFDAQHSFDFETRLPALDTSLLTTVVIAVTAVFTENKIRLKPEKFADVVALVYEASQETKNVDIGYVQRLVKLVI